MSDAGTADGNGDDEGFEGIGISPDEAAAQAEAEASGQGMGMSPDEAAGMHSAGMDPDTGELAAGAEPAAVEDPITGVQSGEPTIGEPPPVVATPPAEPEPAAPAPVKEVTRKKVRRRSLLSEEEGGLLSQAPTYRRSLLGY